MKNTISNWLGGKITEQNKQKTNISNGIRVAIPGIIKSFNATEQTVTVQPAIKEIIYDGQGEEKNISLPVLLDVPIIVPHTGSYAITLPIQEGDECLVIFADMCIDGWWQSGGVQGQIEQRRHDLSDGFAILGPFSQSKKLSNYSTNKLRIINTQTGNGLEVSSSGVNIIGKLSVNGVPVS